MHRSPSRARDASRFSASMYDSGMNRQMQDLTQKKGKGKLEPLLRAGDTWEVK